MWFVLLLLFFLMVLSALFIVPVLLPLPVVERPADGLPADYDSAVSRFRQLKDGERGLVIPACGSLILTHGARTAQVYVLVHGATNSPFQWRELGGILHAQGHNVLILRMPYHGLPSRHVGELKPLSSQALGDYAFEAVDIAAGLGDEMVVAGISGGATVAAWVALKRREVDRVLLLAPFFGVWGLPDTFTKLLVNAFNRMPNINLERPDEKQRHWVYRGEATRGVAAFLTLGQEVLQAAADGFGPTGRVIVLTTANDKTANNHTTAELARCWRKAGTAVTESEFRRDQFVAHNAIGPATEEAKKQVVYERLLSLLEDEALRHQASKTTDA